VPRLGVHSAASETTPISLSFCPALLSEDKRQAENSQSPHGHSVTTTHTLGWIWAFWPLSKECFRDRANASGFLVSGTGGRGDGGGGCVLSRELIEELLELTD